MITIDELKTRWKLDCLIDDVDIQKASVDSPRLHARYLGYLIDAKTELRKSANQCISLRKELIRYYSGLFTKEELDEKGWTQYQGKKPLKGELETMISAYPVYVELENRMNELEILIEALESIIKELYQRSYIIKNIIQARIFESGN